MSPSQLLPLEVLRRPIESTLAAGVAVMDERDIGTCTALSESHPQCVEDEVGAHVSCELPADDRPAVGVDHEREEHDALPAAQVGEVSEPELIRPARAEVALDKIRLPLRPQVGLGVSASAYYERRSGRRSARAVGDERLLGRIRELHASNYYAFGYRRMWKALQRAGERVPRCRVQRLMRSAGIEGAKRRSKPWRTTRPDPQAQRRPDLVQRDFTASRSNQLWVADLSYLRCWEGLIRLSELQLAVSCGRRCRSCLGSRGSV